MEIQIGVCRCRETKNAPRGCIFCFFGAGSDYFTASIALQMSEVMVSSSPSPLMWA
ncbi:unknown [Bacteroides sp. CAG:598]|nr:unknown [Bacteroides sp. CAG:598]